MHFLFSFDDAPSSVHANQYNHCLVNVWFCFCFSLPPLKTGSTSWVPAVIGVTVNRSRKQKPFFNFAQLAKEFKKKKKKNERRKRLCVILASCKGKEDKDSKRRKATRLRWMSRKLKWKICAKTVKISVYIP